MMVKLGILGIRNTWGKTVTEPTTNSTQATLVGCELSHHKNNYEQL